MNLKLDLPQLRLIAEAHAALSEPAAADEIEVLPALVKKLLDQAQAQVGEQWFRIDLDAQEASDLEKVLAAQLESAAEEGDVFRLGEIPMILSQLG